MPIMQQYRRARRDKDKREALKALARAWDQGEDHRLFLERALDAGCSLEAIELATPPHAIHWDEAHLGAA